MTSHFNMARKRRNSREDRHRLHDPDHGLPHSCSFTFQDVTTASQSCHEQACQDNYEGEDTQTIGNEKLDETVSDEQVPEDSPHDGSDSDTDTNDNDDGGGAQNSGAKDGVSPFGQDANDATVDLEEVFEAAHGDSRSEILGANPLSTKTRQDLAGNKSTQCSTRE